MTKKERQKKIIEEVMNRRKISSVELASDLNVSEDTIRRDINQLDNKGLLKKVHGGAVSTIQKMYHYNDSAVFNLTKKQIVAKKAISLISDGMVIIMSGGTTNLIFAKQLPKTLKATIYTYSLPIALQLAEYPNIDIIFMGGKIEKQSMVTIGMDVSKILFGLRADICFMGVSGITPEHGVTDEGYEVSQVKQAMIMASDKVISLMTSNKLGVRQAYMACDVSKLDVLVTELDSKNPILKPYLDLGVHIL
jgi:DeoR/GlpR family transcriptional regulator of sugar metabolism